MFTLGGTYFPRETLPDGLPAIATVLPLVSLTDLLRWNLGLPQLWWLRAVWVLVLVMLCAAEAIRKIYPKLVQ